MPDTTDLTAEDLAGAIQTALEAIEYADHDDLPCELADLADHLTGARFESYADGGYLTRDAGLVIHLAGRRFQITIVEDPR
jgi:hypothetical protein